MVSRLDRPTLIHGQTSRTLIGQISRRLIHDQISRSSTNPSPPKRIDAVYLGTTITIAALISTATVSALRGRSILVDPNPIASEPLKVPIEPNRATAELAELYETYRDAALNREYYGRLLARHQRNNTIIEVIIALGATSSGISGLTVIKDEPYGLYVWGVITSIAAVLAIAKPFLQFHKKIERYSRLFTGHLDNYITLNSLVIRIRRKQELTEDMIRQFERAEQRYSQLSRGDDPIKDISLCKQCEEIIRREIPDTVLWYPTIEQSNVTPLRPGQTAQP